MNWKLRIGSTALAFAFSSALFIPTANSAEWACEFSEPITGGMLHLLITGTENTPGGIQGAVEHLAQPLGRFACRQGFHPDPGVRHPIQGQINPIQAEIVVLAILEVVDHLQGQA